MNAGYIDEDERYFCQEYWTAEASAGHRPVSVLHDEPPPEDKFWLVDQCARCRRSIQYTVTATLV